MTGDELLEFLGGAISTHTLTWSVTFTINGYRRTERHFNSHAHVERDVGMEDTADEPVDISTHTLTWSVT